MSLSRDRASTRSPLRLVRFAGLSEVPHAITTRRGGVSTGPYSTLNMGLSTADLKENVLANRQILFESFGTTSQQTRVGRLSHGDSVSVYKSGNSLASSDDGFFRSDAVVSDVENLYFLLTFADCTPLALYDPRRKIVGAMHAGWRGTAHGIAAKTVRETSQTFGSHPADLHVGIGPSIGPCCCAIGLDVLALFRSQGYTPVTAERHGTTYLDLWATNENQLRSAGILSRNIENPRICTRCNLDVFYSHRGEGGSTGRFALYIGLGA